MSADFWKFWGAAIVLGVLVGHLIDRRRARRLPRGWTLKWVFPNGEDQPPHPLCQCPICNAWRRNRR